MNGLYIGIGLTLILALLTALIGPFFVDWGTYRAVFEREATQIVGLPVTVIGEVDARLLPSPRIRFGDVVIGSMEAPLARIGRFELDLEAAPLLRGDVRVSELKLERPSVDLAIGADGRLLLPARSAETLDPGAVAIDRIEISDGRLAVTDARSGGRFEIGRVAAIGSAASLSGPWRVDGAGAKGGRRISFHLAGGRAADGATAVKLQAAADDDPATVSADLTLREGPSGPSLAGRAIVERHGGESGDLAAALGTWRAEAQIAGDARAIEATGLTLALGPEERAAQFTGQGRLRLGAEPGFEATLAARQIEADRLTGGEAGRTAVPAEVAAQLLARIAGAGDPGLTGRVTVEVQGLVVGGGAVQEVTLEARTRPGGLTIDRLEARLPGRSRVETSGRIAFDDGARFDGRVEIASEQPSALAGWWRAEAVGDRLDPVSVTATVSVGAGRLQADELRIEVAKARARGHFEWTEAGLRAALAADRLELDQVSRLARLFLGRDAARRPASLALDLDAGQMVLGGVVAKGVAIGVTVGAADVVVERLTVQDLAGARLSGSGRIADPLGAPRGMLDLTLDAVRPEAPVRALAGLSGLEPEAAERVAGLAALAAPLGLTLHFEGRGDGQGASLTASLRGFAGGAEVTSDVGFEGRVDDPTHGTLRVKTRLAGEKASAGLVRMFGGGAAEGPLAVDLSVEGRPVDGVAVTANARVGATSGGIEGKARFAADTAATFDGRVRLATPDATALGALVGRPVLAFERRLPVDASALMRGTRSKLEIGELAGRVGETAVRGQLALDLAAKPARVDGRVDLDRLDLEAVAEALLGGAVLGDGSDPAAIFATTPFVGPATDWTIGGALQVSVEKVGAGAIGFDRVRARLTARPGEMRLEGIEAGFAGGRIGGEIGAERRADGTTALGGRVKLERANLADVVWRRAGRPVITGRIDGEARFDSVGRSMAALASGLAGEGRVAIGGARAIGLGGDAFAETRPAAGATQPTAEAVEAAFRARFDATESELAALEIPFALQGGVVRTGRLVVATPTARLSGRAAIDLARATIDADGSLEPVGPALEATKTAISKATPSVGLAFRGPIAQPLRSLDVAPLVAHQTLFGIEREVERVEALQKDIAERARVARERRAQEEARAAEEAAKKAAEETAKREAEAKKAADEAAKKAAEDVAKKPAAPVKPGAAVAPVEGVKPGEAAKAPDVAKSVEPGRATTGAAPAQPQPGASPTGMEAVKAVVDGFATGSGSGAPAASEGTAPPPLPPPIVIPPAPPILSKPANPPLSIVPPTVGAP